MQYYVTSFGGKAKEMIQKLTGWENWDVRYFIPRLKADKNVVSF